MTDTFLCGVIEGFYGRPWTAEQRHELFEWMRAWGMNLYMYGPKDDLKMRAAWRVPYDVEELRDLSELLVRCRDRDIAFVYTIAPGLDIRYADPDELAALSGKVDQLLDAGVEHLCILFDDIPFHMRDEDRERFSSFARAQAHVANALLDHVRRRWTACSCFAPPTTARAWPGRRWPSRRTCASSASA